MKVLIACEFSGVVREAFKERGHNALSCDFLETLIPGNHYQGDVRKIIHQEWDLIIAHPPCTYLANSGARWLYSKPERWLYLDRAAKFFRLFLEHPCKKVCVENPVPHKHAVERIGRNYDQLVQPWMFGHMESKATCLWLKGLPPLKETQNVKAEMKLLPNYKQKRMHWMGESKSRQLQRSITYLGIARAMAQQWS